MAFQFPVTIHSHGCQT